MKKLKAAQNTLLPLISVVAVILVWYLSALALNIELILPTPLQTLNSLIAALGNGEFYISLMWTVVRTLFAFALAFVCAFVFAFVTASSEVFKRLFYPIIVVLRAIPTISIIFILYVSVKQNNRSVLIAFLVIFPTLYSAFYTAITEVDAELLELSRVFKVRRRNVVGKLMIPAIAVSVYSETVNAVSLTVKLMVAAEAITQTGMSLGNLMNIAKVNFEMGDLLAYTVAAVVLSYLLELVMRAIKALVVLAVKRKADRESQPIERAESAA